MKDRFPDGLKKFEEGKFHGCDILWEQSWLQKGGLALCKQLLDPRAFPKPSGDCELNMLVFGGRKL